MATTNTFARLSRMLSGGPLQTGTVVAYAGGVATVEYPGGARESARGPATVGQRVFVRGGVIEGEAPALPVHIASV